MATRHALPLAFLLVGCGASSGANTAANTPPPAPVAPRAHASGGDRAASDDGCPATGGMSIEGQLGTLPQPRVRRALQDAEGRLSACYTSRLEAMPCLSGRVGFKLRVGTDGAHRWVIPTASTVGDGEVERCMRDVLMGLEFGRPCGGEAEVTWSMEFDAGPDARPPTAWPATRVGAALTQSRAALARCRNGVRDGVHVTLYAAPDGTVAAVGAAVDTPAAAPVAECALGVIRAWRLPSPGSWYARTSFDLP
ncbi:MAG: AgmX/PglI C-terminal domain-containing protein [Polyangiales bacterium]